MLGKQSPGPGEYLHLISRFYRYMYEKRRPLNANVVSQVTLASVCQCGPYGTNQRDICDYYNKQNRLQFNLIFFLNYTYFE